MPGASQYFTSTDYVMILPIVMLTLFALGILLFDLMAPEWKRLNAFVAFGGLFFAATGITGIPSFGFFRGTQGVYSHMLKRCVFTEYRSIGAFRFNAD